MQVYLPSSGLQGSTVPWYLKGFLPCPVHLAPLSQSCACPRCAAAHPPGITSAPFHALGLLTYILVVKGEWISLSHGMGQDLAMCLSSFSARKHLCVECKVPLHFNVSHFKRQCPSITSNSVRQWGCHPPVMPERGRSREENTVYMSREQQRDLLPGSLVLLTVCLHFLLGTELRKFTWSQCIFSAHLWQNKNWGPSTPSQKTCTVCAADR